jgi:hypothetical protein
MRDLGRDYPVLLLRNRGHLVVELLSTTDQRFTAALTTMPAQPSAVEGAVVEFVASAVSALPDKSVGAYLQRLLATCLQQCHGTLLATVRQQADLSSLYDGVWPDKQISIPELHKIALAAGTADALADLQAAEAVLAGMINSDGVVLFDEAGSILAYRVFLRPNELERATIAYRGGGRHRAFELMQLRLGTVFGAALFSISRRRDQVHEGKVVGENSNSLVQWAPSEVVDIPRGASPEQIVELGKPQLSTRDMRSIVAGVQSGSYEMVAT